MPIPYNRKMIPRAKALRKNMTPQERKLWFLFLRNYPVKFQRQKTIDSFIVDFFCVKASLAVEIDGEPHFSDQGIAYDIDRSAILQRSFIEIVRFTNKDIDNRFTDVCKEIDEKVKLLIKEKDRSLLFGGNHN